MPDCWQVLDTMAAGGVDGDDETYEWIANAAVKDVEFVTVREREREVWITFSTLRTHN